MTSRAAAFMIGAFWFTGCGETSTPPPSDAGLPTDSAAACYSPTMNQNVAVNARSGGDAGVGCSCRVGEDADQCATVPGGGKVALFCRDGKWVAGYDGPCAADAGSS